MDMARASELPDSESETVARSWRALVERCARALGRSASNLPAYTSSTSVSRQLAALGAFLVSLTVYLPPPPQGGVELYFDPLESGSRRRERTENTEAS